MTLKEYVNKCKKEDIYNFYIKIVKNPKDYKCISRNDIYKDIISLYKEDPELILKLCNVEEINILKKLLEKNLNPKAGGYIEYLLFMNLKNNFLVIEEEKYYIPNDILNYVKMALNLYDEKIYSLQDITESILVGLIRIYNVLTLDELNNLLNSYYVQISDLKDYIINNYKFKNIMIVKKYQKIEYVVSLENYYYKDVIPLKRKDILLKKYNLEEVISIGKYKINLFLEPVFKFLNFLEVHLDRIYIDMVINEMLVYAGFDLNDEFVLNKIADEIPELFTEMKEAINYFPIWIYNGNNLKSVKENLVLPKKNDPCSCGSGKKFKHCCRKYYKQK